MLRNAPEATALHDSLCELAQTVGEAVKEDVGPIREELTLVKSLLLEASQQLQQSFLSLNTQTRAQLLHVKTLHAEARVARKSTVPTSGNSEAPIAAQTEEFSRISAQIIGSIDDAVRALQFEDMATQLIDCVQRRIDRLAAVTVRLENIVVHFERTPNDHTIEASASLIELRAHLQSLKSEYATTLVSPVGVEGLAGGGSVDLF